MIKWNISVLFVILLKLDIYTLIMHITFSWSAWSSCLQLSCFKFLSTTLAQTMQRSSHLGSTTHEQVDQYLAEVQRLTANQLSMPSDALSFWQQKTSHNLLAPATEDFICAPASQAFVERYFLCVSFSAVVVTAACTSHWKCTHALS